MKVIPLNKADNVAVYVDDSTFVYNPATDVMNGVSAAQANFPAVNVLDNHPKKVCKADYDPDPGDDVGVVYTIKMTDVSSGVAVFNTNAKSATIEILDASDGSSLYEFEFTLKGARTYQELISDQNLADLSECMVTYPYIGMEHIVNIYLSTGTDDPDTITAGVIFVGMQETFSNPDLGATQSFKDYSIVSELASGATYVLKRDLVRTFDFSVDMEECATCPKRLRDIFMDLGPEPVPWLISDSDAIMWLVFARKDTELTSTYHAHTRVKAKARLIEVL